MKLIVSVVYFLTGRKRRPSLFSSALTEGIRDTLIEMGYHPEGKRKEHRTSGRPETATE